MMKSFFEFYTGHVLLCGLLFVLKLGEIVAGDFCEGKEGQRTYTKYCDYGCCGSYESLECCTYTMSISVIIVAGIVGGLVVVALIVAFIICCVKNYQDKQRNRVRRLRQNENQAHYDLPRAPARVPKPPEYMEAPPPYSLDMPTSHFRPPTVNGQYNYNTRFQRSHVRSTPMATTIPENSTPVTSSNQTNTSNNPSHNTGVVIPGMSVQQEASNPTPAPPPASAPPMSNGAGQNQSLHPPNPSGRRSEPRGTSPSRTVTNTTAINNNTFANSLNNNFSNNNTNGRSISSSRTGGQSFAYGPPPTPLNPATLPGSTFSEPPPAYSEFARGQTPRNPPAESQLSSV